MTVYAEIVLISNFFIDLFLATLTLTLLNAPVLRIRLFLTALFGAVLSAIYPLTASYGIILKILGGLLMPIILRKNANIKEYFITVCVFVGVTLALGGGVLYISSINTIGWDYHKLTYGLFPIVLSMTAFLILILVRYILKNLKKTRNLSENTYRVKLYNNTAQFVGTAFYDSGNQVYTKNGECVVIVDTSIYNSLMPADEDEIEVRTVTSIARLKTMDIIVEIYFDDGTNKIYKAKAAKGDLDLNGNKILLHSEMLGECL